MGSAAIALAYSLGGYEVEIPIVHGANRTDVIKGAQIIGTGDNDRRNISYLFNLIAILANMACGSILFAISKGQLPLKEGMSSIRDSHSGRKRHLFNG